MFFVSSRRRHTRYWRDWSSDVCSSDLGVRHALAAIDGGKHLVMVNVEADVLCGPLLAARARARNLVYSMAYGDQPAIICELVDWVRSCGFELTSAGKGMNFEQIGRASCRERV